MTTAEPAEGTVGGGGDYQPVVEEEPAEESTEQTKKSDDEIANEVIAGHWGRGNDCRFRLEEAGYDVNAIMEKVAKRVNSDQ